MSRPEIGFVKVMSLLFALEIAPSVRVRESSIVLLIPANPERIWRLSEQAPQSLSDHRQSICLRGRELGPCATNPAV